MKYLILAAGIAAIGVAVAGCDTSLEGRYKPYDPTTPAAELWPVPDSTDAQPAAYRQAPATAPTTRPVESGG